MRDIKRGWVNFFVFRQLDILGDFAEFAKLFTFSDLGVVGVIFIQVGLQIAKFILAHLLLVHIIRVDCTNVSHFNDLLFLFRFFCL